MSTNINSTEQIVEINAGDQITNINLVSQSTTQVVSGEQVVTVDVNAGTIPAAWGSITGTLSNQTDLQNALNAKQNNITLTTTGTSGVATLVGATLNIPNYTDTGLTSVGVSMPTGFDVSGSPLTSNGTINVNFASGYGLPTTTKQGQWDSAYNDKITSAEVSGTTTKTLTLNQQDGGTITASWSDFDTAPVTSVFGRTGNVVATEGDYNIGQMGDVTITSASNGQVLKYNGTAWVNAADASGLTSVGLAMPSAFTVSGSPLTSNGTITVTGAGTTSQYVRGDGSLATFPSTSQEALRLISEVYNQTGATLTKGTIVYINGAHGNLPTVTKAIATGDSTSAQTFGFVQNDITNQNNGFIVIAGKLTGLNTQGIAEGSQLYLSSTIAGGYTTTKQYAPNHLVYVGVVNRAHPTQGEIEVKIQNGYEMDELHNVSARFPSNKDGIFYNSTTSVWENKSIAGVLGYTPVPETRIITINGTAQNLSADRTYNVGTVTNVAASGGTGISIGGSPVTGSGTITITNTAPDQVVSLTGAGTTTTSGTYPNFTITSNDQYVGTVTSVNATVPTGFEVSGVPITSSGTVDIKFAAGYSLPTNAKQSEWDTAYTKRLDSLTVTGNSGSSTLTSNVLNVPTYTLAGLGGEPAITAGTTSQYWRGDKSFQTLDTSVVPENGAIYFTEPRVRATVLSGMNITGGAITASDNILNAFGKVQNQINGLIGGSIFQSTWNASTNNPALASGVGTKGYYYIVSTAGTTNLDGITDWQIGDWAIFDGTVWRKVDNTDAVVSVNGYTGIVSLVLDDLADVSAASPTDTQLLRFNGTTSKWYNWTPTYISGNQTITLSGDVAGSGTTAITTTIGALKVTNAMLAGSIDYAKMDSATVPTWNQNTTGNAATATKLATARNFTINGTAKSFDGSANVAWTDAEIGLTSYLPLAGGAMTGRFTMSNTNSTYTDPSTTNVPSIYIYNTNNTSTNAHAILALRTGGESAASASGNPFISFDIATVIGWSVGVDNADSDKFKISKSWSTLGSNNYFSIDTSGVTTLSGSLNGTSASFSGTGSFSGNVTLASGSDLIITPATSGSNATLYNDIGKLVSTASLVVQGTGEFSGALSGTSATFSSSVTAGGSVSITNGQYFIYDTRSDAANRNWVLVSNANVYGDFAIRQSNVKDGNPLSAGTDRITINPSGNVGIGTSSPNYILDVQKSTNAVIQAKATASAGSAYSGLLLGSPSVTWNILNDDSGGGGDLRFYNDSLASDAIRIKKSNNNVGIGTSSPSANLVVGTQSSGSSGASYAADNSIIARVGAAYSANRVVGFTIANTAAAAVNNEATLSFIVANNFSATGLISSILTNSNTAATDMTFFTYSGGLTERMRITSGGNVLIGETTSSTSRLVVRKDAAGARGGEISIVNYTASTLNSSAALNFGLEASTYDADLGNAQIKAQITNAGNSASDIIMSTWNGSAFGERFRIASAGAATFSSSVTATSFFESSDMRLKSNIQDYKSNDILNISAKIYEKDGKIEVGYLAQDLQSVLKSAVSVRDNGYLDLSYRQVHTAKIAVLEAKIKELEAKLK